jgi:iron complex outermembrane receptor protein
MYAKKTILTLSALFFAWFVQAQQVSGTVKDAATGEPLPGASVVVKGTSTGTSTTFDGEFSIPANNGDVLVFLAYIL